MQLNQEHIYDCQRNPILPTQISCYAMTGEERRKSSERISVPPEIIRDVIREMMKEYEDAGLPEQRERIKVLYT